MINCKFTKVVYRLQYLDKFYVSLDLFLTSFPRPLNEHFVTGQTNYACRQYISNAEGAAKVLHRSRS